MTPSSADASSSPEVAADRRPRFNKKTMFVLGAMNMMDCVNLNLMLPYADRMVSDFLQTTPDDPSVAHAVGLLMGLFSLCEVLFSPLWGDFSDRAGRKPALLIGIGGSIAASILGGLGENLTTVFVARALSGFFCGNTGVTRTYLGEIVDETNEADGFGFLSICFSVGMFIGPTLGGELVFPARWAPSVFAGTIFEERPFLLPNLVYAVCAAVAWIIGALFLEETLPKSERRPLCCCCRGRRRRCQQQGGQQRAFLLRSSSSAADGGSIVGWTLPNPPPDVPPSFLSRVFVTPTSAEVHQPSPNISSEVEVLGVDQIGEQQQSLGGSRCVLVQAILCYAAISGWFTGATQLFVLIVSIPRDVDGFELGPRQIGALQAVSAASLLINQLLFYKLATTRLGLFWNFVVGWTLCMIAHLLFPVYGIWADPESFGFWRYAPLIVMQILQGFGDGLIFATAFIYINRASAGLAKGVVNGWAYASGALCRVIFPPCAAFLLTWGDGDVNAHWGRYVSVYVNCLVGTLLLAAALPGMYKLG